LYLDLPGHGGSAHLSVSGFEAVNALLESTLISYNILNYWLVGYSLGGRIAMFHAAQQPPGLCGLIVEGGHRGCKMPKNALPDASPTGAGQRVFASSRSSLFLPTGTNSLFLRLSRMRNVAT
jgi:pimeloyl-ACP methyl ester carboxylesterase